MTEKNKKKIEDRKHRGSWFGVDPHPKIVKDKKKEEKKKKCRKPIDF